MLLHPHRHKTSAFDTLSPADPQDSPQVSQIECVKSDDLLLQPSSQHLSSSRPPGAREGAPGGREEERRWKLGCCFL